MFTSAMSRRKPLQRLRFSKAELNTSGPEKKIAKLERKAEKIAPQLDQAHTKLPLKKSLVKERVFNDQCQKAKSKLTFKRAPVPVNEAKWNKPRQRSLPRKAAGALTTAGVNNLHGKIYEIEHENAGVQTAHKAELAGESVFRGTKQVTHSAYRFIRNTPYRRVAKLEAKSVKNEAKLTYQKILRDNPRLKSNPVSRILQKRSIKKQYAQALRTAQKTGQTIKPTVSLVQKATQLATNLIRRNPIWLVKLGALLLLLLLIMSLFSMAATLFSGTMAFIGASSYAAEDTDINQAELMYTKWEADLQVRIHDTPNLYPGYDVYRYNIGNIGHDPFKLLAFLTAVYDHFTYAQVRPVLQEIFSRQYQLTYTESTETDDDDTIHILTVTLTSASFGDLLTPLMNSEQQQRYEIFMQSKGGRQYVNNPFTFNWLPYVSGNYGYRTNQATGVERLYQGVDIAVPQGTEIHAGFDGKVIAAGHDSTNGNYVLLQSKDGVQVKYAHCATLAVTAGQTVKNGDVIGTVGSTGNVSGPELYLEITKNGQTLNPVYFALTGDDGSANLPPGSPGGVVIPANPGASMSDSQYAALMEVAQAQLGKPYVYGAAGPNSFDCSGFVCYCLNQSGVANVGRTTAQGLYNMCTPVAPAEAQPGDLVFFTGTYDCGTPVTHIGIYIGNGMMIAAGDPVKYTDITTNYWQQHFYAFGRLSG